MQSDVSRTNDATPLVGGVPTNQTEVRMHIHQEDLTEVEGLVIEALRSATRAQTDEEYRNNNEAWNLIRQEVDWYVAGEFTMEDAAQSWGTVQAATYFAAIQAIAALKPMFHPDFNKKGDARNAS